MLFIRAVCQAKCRQPQAGAVIETEDTAHQHGDKSLRRAEVKKEHSTEGKIYKTEEKTGIALLRRSPCTQTPPRSAANDSSRSNRLPAELSITPRKLHITVKIPMLCRAGENECRWREYHWIATTVFSFFSTPSLPHPPFPFPPGESNNATMQMSSGCRGTAGTQVTVRRMQLCRSQFTLEKKGQRKEKKREKEGKKKEKEKKEITVWF